MEHLRTYPMGGHVEGLVKSYAEVLDSLFSLNVSPIDLMLAHLVLVEIALFHHGNVVKLCRTDYTLATSRGPTASLVVVQYQFPRQTRDRSLLKRTP